MQQVRCLLRATHAQFRLLLWSAGIIAFLWAMRFVWPQKPPKKAKIIDFTVAAGKSKRKTNNMSGKVLEDWGWPQDAGKRKALLNGLKRSGGNTVVLDPKQELEELQKEASKEKLAK